MCLQFDMYLIAYLHFRSKKKSACWFHTLKKTPNISHNITIICKNSDFVIKIQYKCKIECIPSFPTKNSWSSWFLDLHLLSFFKNRFGHWLFTNVLHTNKQQHYFCTFFFLSSNFCPQILEFLILFHRFITLITLHFFITVFTTNSFDYPWLILNNNLDYFESWWKNSSK